MQREIDHYHPTKAISNAMLKLAEIGFEFSGHGYAFMDGSEDFSVVKNFRGGYIYVEFQRQNNKSSAQYSVKTEDDKEFYSKCNKPAIIVKSVAKLKTKKDCLAIVSAV